MTKLKQIKIPPNEWHQIGGDVDFEDHLILGKFDDRLDEIHVVEIQRYNDNKYHGHEAIFDIQDLKDHTLEEYGFDAKAMKNHGLELIAESKLTNDGGDPINCDGLADYKSQFKSFKSALKCAIGNTSFKNWNNRTISIKDIH